MRVMKNAYWDSLSTDQAVNEASSKSSVEVHKFARRFRSALRSGNGAAYAIGAYPLLNKLEQRIQPGAGDSIAR